MHAHGLSAPYHPIRRRGSKAHDGRVTSGVPDEVWGTDATQVVVTREGTATLFIAVDHCTAECIGIHAARRGTRHEALEPLRQGVRQHFGIYDHHVAHGLTLRHDHGSQYMSHDFQDELRFLGIRSSPAFEAEPECNGGAERFIRTLREQLLWVETFDTIEDFRLALYAFRRRYNASCLVQRTNIAPRQVRALLSPPVAHAACN